MLRIGGERTTETALPLGHNQQKLPSRFEPFDPLFAACFEGINTPLNSMASRVGIVLQDHLAGFIERECQTSQPANETPQQSWRNDRLVIRIFVAFLLTRLHGIADLPAVVAHRGAIRHASRTAFRGWWCVSFR